MPFICRNDVSLYFETMVGPRQPLVFIHGWCCDRTFFSPQVDRFSQLGHQIVIPDLRGHGLSEKPHQPYSIQGFSDDVASLCQEVKLSKPVLIGHSMGGIVAFDIASRYPDLPGAIIMLDSAVILPAEAKAHIPAFLQRLRRSDYAKTLQNFLSSAFFLPSDDGSRKEAIIELMVSAPHHVMTGAYQGLADYDAIAVDRVKVPSLYVLANELSRRCDIDRLKGIIPHLDVGQTVKSGHFLQLEVPEQVNAMMERFLLSTITKPS
jgi:pimeloyl-ACP methyl ester carboxylesterase